MEFQGMLMDTYIDFFFQHYQKLREHVDRAHLTERPYKCEPCGFSHAKRWGLETHLQSREHKKNTEGPQDGTCDTCGEVCMYF